MNKTVTANISGIVFHIEVDAYEKLSSYLNKIRSYFQNSDEREEIMTDIEARIAELLSVKLKGDNQVIREKDVDEVVEIMGKPEQYVQDDEEASSETNERTTSASQTKTKRRLFRDSDDRILGGVASGISHYTGIDPIWLRLLFILIVLVGGSGLLIYIILWIVIPEAKTAAQKLQMKGEPVTIDNIGKAFEDGAKKVNEQFQNIDSKGFGRKLEQFFESIFHVLGVIIMGFLRFFGKLLGIALFVVGIILAFTIITSLMSTGSVIYSLSPEGIYALDSKELFLSVFESAQQYLFVKYTIMVLLIAPVLALIYGGAKLLFGFKRHTGIGTVLGIIWLVGIGASIILSLQMASQFKSESKVTEYYNIESNFSEYVIELNQDMLPGEELISLSDSEFLLSMDKGNIYYGMPELNIEKSYKDSVQLRIVKSSRGHSRRQSTDNAKDIDYSIQQQGELLSFNSFISFDRKRKIRGQDVQLTLLLPIGKTIYLDHSIQELIYDIENVTNTRDSDMLGKKWMMLEDGLTCLDCADIEGVSSGEVKEDVEVMY